MNKRFFPILTFILVLISTQVALAEAPSGFSLINSAEGVELYRKDYANGTPDYVQVVKLNQGAEIRLLHGAVKENRPGVGVYGGDDPRIGFRSLEGFWEELSSEPDRAFCVSNGQFFLMRESPTRLPFPLKVDGQILTDGYAKQEFPDQKLMLELWPDRAAISPLSRDTLYGSDAPNIVAGLTEDARKSPTKYVGRTFVGIADQNGDSINETVLIFSTRSARQKDAADVLRDFGATQVMMLDGGGSAQLTCGGGGLVTSERLIPQALGVLSAPPGYRENQMEVVIAPTPYPAPEAESSPVVPPVAAQVEVENQPPLAESAVASANLPEARLAATGPLVDDVFDMLWIPLMMGPVFMMVFFTVLKSRGR